MESLNKIEGKQSHWHNSLHPITNIFFSSQTEQCKNIFIN